MNLSEKTKAAVTLIQEIVAKKHNLEITETEALDSLVQYAFKSFMNDLPDIQIVKSDEFSK